MTDYPDLYKRLAQEIIKAEGWLAGGAQAFIQSLIEKLRVEGYHLQGGAEAVLTEYLGGINDAIKVSIARAAAIGLGVALAPANLQSKIILDAAEQAFSTHWPDGLNLSERLWSWENATRAGVSDALAAGIKQGQATGKILHDMQRTIERTTGERFAVVGAHKADWVHRLADAGRELINEPSDRAHWNKVVADTEKYIDKLATTGTRHDAQRLLFEIKKATKKGRYAAIERAVHWKIYNKQLYNLRRIARTEMADAGHNAVIGSTEGDDMIIGYQWRLSGSHKVADICDYYANIDMGLGKGVFTKDAVPRHKAHPHCMCLIIPRVTPIKQAGSKNYAQFITRLGDTQRGQILPKWVDKAVAEGAKLEKLMRPDGLGLLPKNAYTIARAGGKHAQWSERQFKLSEAELNRGIRSFEKLMENHRQWIGDPTTKVKNFHELDRRRQDNLVNHHWPRDIERHRECMAILENILAEKKHGKT